MKRLLLLVQIIFALCIAHETPSSEVCKDVGENGWFPGSDELFDEDCRTGVPPQLCNTDALKCGHGKCCVYHSVCGRGSALLGESPQMCRKATDCLAYGISSTISAKCVQGVCCRRKIVKRRFDPTVCPKDKSPDLCDCYKKKCRCDGKRKCYQYEKGKDKICCTDIFCKTGLLSGYDHRNGAVFLHDQRKKRTAYMEGHLLCSIPLSNELRNFIRPKWAYFAARKRYQARGFNAADPSLLPTCSSNKECLGGYCDVVFSLRRDESRKACFNSEFLS
ncbi:unnamed protein product [Caenorhabditis auriculariae]|uniref:Uncharacterized protein n=1 Tax=Caenorhabditis auriculariae TaxID=2777116 RepID=A0A8S1HJ19_9PELO|nr:unnamed protein product [Caenorhabditis auriculariae]